MDVFILVFDEVMFSLDFEIEVQIQVVMDEFIEGCILIIIVYWFLMIWNVDWILVFDCGWIVEDGCYEEFLEWVDGYYWWFYLIQMGGI